MDQRTRAYLASGAIVGIFLLVQLGALALVGPFEAGGYQAFENPQDPTNTVYYAVAILVATGFLLAALKFDFETLLRLLLVGSGAYITLFVLRLFVPPVVAVSVGPVPVNVPAVAAALGVGLALWFHPEWYVIDATGVVMGAGAAALFGISFGLLPAVLLLTVLAIYDAISVYGTEHMLTLASGVMDLKAPIVLVVPLSLSYSYLDAEMPEPESDGEGAAGESDGEPAGTGAETALTDGPAPESDAGDDATAEESAASEPETGEGEVVTDEDEEDGGPLDREALFIGLGDAVIPSVLVASAAVFAPSSVPAYDLLGVTATLPALTAMVGTTAGLVVLLRMVLKGRAHAGLPLLNGGTIAGYLVGALASGMTLVQALGLSPYL